MVVERVWLEQVDDVEPVRLPRHGVGYSEVVPLGVAARVVVWLENQVIFKLILKSNLANVTFVEKDSPDLPTYQVIFKFIQKNVNLIMH